jgi:hypothetical protein
MRIVKIALCCAGVCAVAWAAETPPPAVPYCIVDTGQIQCFDDADQLFAVPKPGEAYFGQDGFYQGPQPSYRDNGDGTVSDLNTGLMWQKTPNRDQKMTFADAKAQAADCRLGGHSDWRLPTIKDLYSLIDFTGNCHGRPPVPYLNTKFFVFRFGDEQAGERLIDAQYWSCTEYVGRTMHGNPTVFGVNFADGRIKGYPRDQKRDGQYMREFVRYVRGNPDYGRNKFVDNGDGTISDTATGLMWTKADSGKTMNWKDALAWCESLSLAGHDDWRLPNAKELQSIVDYSRAPQATDAARRGPAIDPVFTMTDEESWFWSSTTHLEGGRKLGEFAVYVTFGRATGLMPDRRGDLQSLDVHGAGAQRSDPKSGDPSSPQWVRGHGPQGDQVRIRLYVRAVRNIAKDGVKLITPDTKPLPPSFLPARPMERPGAGRGPGFGPPPR